MQALLGDGDVGLYVRIVIDICGHPRAVGLHDVPIRHHMAVRVDDEAGSESPVRADEHGGTARRLDGIEGPPQPCGAAPGAAGASESRAAGARGLAAAAIAGVCPAWAPRIR